ncbi:site-specific tyrosine recombinase/integron integrase [Pseudostreptobacillus hongkongensis]|uniref:site-specific tyrosine recombinase/integron integrase n=1 Tax=Pseudostreptobacillus hongkongensis TaxID=1162717 RepID=UPI00082BBD68|nr:site-specific tyrosine recombinase/integron integrase [Pseudostreptobacillus hongkongensis]
MKSILSKFIYYQEVVLNKSFNTVKSYKKDLEQFVDYLINNEGINDFNEVEVFTFRSFIAYLNLELKVNKRSINRKLSAIRTFFKYLLENGYIEENKTVYISTPKFEKALPNYLTKDDFDKIRENINLEKILGLRDRAIVELLYSSGIRSMELLDLNESMINFSEREIRVIGKGNKERITFFSNTAKKYILEYIERKKKEYKNYTKDILFVNKNGEKLDSRSLRRLITNYGKKSNLNKEVTPHVFRHSFATELLNQGVDIRYVQELLGHSSIATTQFYTHISKSVLKDAYMKSHPFAK